jgi:fatty acid-binding protein DegV
MKLLGLSLTKPDPTGSILIHQLDTKQGFWELAWRMKKMSSFSQRATTAVLSPQKIRAMYHALADEGASAVLSIPISSSLSVFVNVTQVAAQETTSVSVTVLDSRQRSLGTGFLFETAANLARAGPRVPVILAALFQRDWFYFRS